MGGEARRKGKKNRKHGRQKRRPSGRDQQVRTERNKERHKARRVKWLAKRRKKALAN